MATPKKDVLQMLSIYESLYALNGRFESVLRELKLLQQFDSFRGKPFIKHCQLAVEETRAWVSFEMLDILQSHEESEWARFGRLRSAWERKLGDAGDVLIGAERLKRGFPQKADGIKRAKGRQSRRAT